jgi:hypothetical protein
MSRFSNNATIKAFFSKSDQGFIGETEAVLEELLVSSRRETTVEGSKVEKRGLSELKILSVSGRLSYV